MRHRALSFKAAIALVAISDNTEGSDVRYVSAATGLDYTEARTAIYSLTQKGLVERLKLGKGHRGRPVNILFSTEQGDRLAIQIELDLDTLLSRRA